MDCEWDDDKEEINLRKVMKMEPSLESIQDDLRPEYDLQKLVGGVRGKYYERYRNSRHLVRLEPDVAAAFPTEELVNQALRRLMDSAKTATS